MNAAKKNNKWINTRQTHENGGALPNAAEKKQLVKNQTNHTENTRCFSEIMIINSWYLDISYPKLLLIIDFL